MLVKLNDNACVLIQLSIQLDFRKNKYLIHVPLVFFTLRCMQLSLITARIRKEKFYVILLVRLFVVFYASKVLLLYQCYLVL